MNAPQATTMHRDLDGPDGPIAILIVENDVLVAAEMASILAAAGAEVVGVAASFDEALDKCEHVRPRLALIDLALEGPEDGIELAQQLSERLGIKSIFVTGHSDPKSVARGAFVAPLSWIKKPFGPGTLVAAVQLAIRDLHRR